MTRPESHDPHVSHAADLRLDGLLAEACGVLPPPDLAERIRARLALTPRATVSGRRRLVAAMVLAAGVLAAFGAALWQRGQRAALPPVPVQEPQDPVKPAPTAQDPDPATLAAIAAEVEKQCKLLELPERRAEALASLAFLGAGAVPPLRAQITAERGRAGRPAEILAMLQWSLFQADPADSKQAFGFGPGPITLMCDYSDNQLLAVDATGKEVWRLGDVFGAWDAELTPQGTVLVTEFSVSRVREVDRQGQTLWSFEKLKNPYDADRLASGNTLICDTFGGRVIEVDRQGEVVWTTERKIRPFDADRLASGNTLIADVLQDRVIEVDPKGEIVWEVRGLRNVHDADRLPNGNTLITLRSDQSVVEVDRDGKEVWRLRGLKAPSDADRLPTGQTLVAENTQVRAFDQAGKQVWQQAMTWTVEVNRY